MSNMSDSTDKHIDDPIPVYEDVLVPLNGHNAHNRYNNDDDAQLRQAIEQSMITYTTELQNKPIPVKQCQLSDQPETPKNGNKQLHTTIVKGEIVRKWI